MSIHIKIIYRNYKPIHKIYESLISNPPKNVVYTLPPVKKQLAFAMPLYRKLRHTRLIKFATSMVSKYVFSSVQEKEPIFDLFHVVNMIPDVINPNIPYILEAEHAAALTNFTNDPVLLQKARSFILSSSCGAVICTSKASKKTFRHLLGSSYGKVSDKIKVVYPSVAIAKGRKVDPSVMGRNSEKVKLLFVGNDCYRKGLHELLEALKSIEPEVRSKIDLYIVSSDAKKLVEQYGLPNVKLYPPIYTKEDIITKFFSPADVFVLPTRLDTFGMVIVDAMSAGTPVLATKQFAIPELVEHKKDGLLIEYPDAILDQRLYRTAVDRQAVNSKELDEAFSNNIKDSLLYIISNTNQIKKMGKNARQKYRKGRHSIAERNKQLASIYNKVLKDNETQV